MEYKYAVALIKDGDEKILGVFETRAEADEYGYSNLVPQDEGLQYCFASTFLGNTPCGSDISIYSTYNA